MTNIEKICLENLYREEFQSHGLIPFEELAWNADIGLHDAYGTAYKVACNYVDEQNVWSREFPKVRETLVEFGVIVEDPDGPNITCAFLTEDGFGFNWLRVINSALGEGIELVGAV